MTGLSPRERREGDRQRGARSAASLLARLEREIDPDGQLPPEERTRLAEEARREHYRRAGRKGRTAQLARKPRSVPPAEGVRTAAAAGKARPPAPVAPVTVAGGRRAEGQRSSDAPVDPAWWEPPEVRAALAVHDIGTVYRALRTAGISQRQIAAMTGQSQSEVSEVIKGRQVMTYDVLARIADSLGIPRHYMGLSSYGPDGSDCTYPGEVTVADPIEGDEMLRRHFQQLLGVGAVAAFGVSIPGLGDAATALATPPIPADMPSRIGSADVAMIRRSVEELRALARSNGGQARASVQLAEWADQWLAADCAEAVRRELLSMLSDMHWGVAWACHDVGAVARSHHHFSRAIELAADAGDSYAAAMAMRQAGMMLLDRGEPDNALKLIQLGHVRLGSAPRDDLRVRAVGSWLHIEAAMAYARLGQSESARSELAAARDGWAPPNAYSRADMDLVTALTWMDLGQVDSAHAAAALSVQTFGQTPDRREGVVADLTLARLHVQAGEPPGLTLAAGAIEGVAATRSGLARRLWLPPLADALQARPGAEARELARRARQVAAAAA